jgi:osmoprotectant transport system permease protein
MTWSWIPQNLAQIRELTWQNALIGISAALIGLVISVPLGIACVRWKRLYPPVLSITSALYAIPSIALFVVLIAYTGLTDTTVIIALTVFSLCVLVPNVVDGLRAVPEPVRQAATAMGFGELQRLVRVELPIAIPVIMAGLRIATVSSISLASLGQLIGVSTLGYFFIDGLQRSFPTEIYVGIFLVIALALVADLVLVTIRRLLTPWQRKTRARPPSVLTPGAPATPEPESDRAGREITAGVS